LIALSLPLNCTKLIAAVLFSSAAGKNGRNDSTAFCASTAEFRPDAHHSENAFEYVIGNDWLDKPGRVFVEVAVAMGRGKRLMARRATEILDL
jgi:hypothetical protein